MIRRSGREQRRVDANEIRRELGGGVRGDGVEIIA